MKKIKIKKKPLIFLLILLTVGIVGTTFAYYYTGVVTSNQFKTKTYSVAIEEEFYNEFGTKKVSFVNKSKDGVPVLLRMSYNENWVKTIEENEEVIENFLPLEMENPDNSGPPVNTVTKIWTSSFTNQFVYNSTDGWYYYKKVLEPEESVQVLESINRIINLPLEYEGYTYRLNFSMEAIQATKAAAQNNWGQTVSINGGDVSWPNI